MLTSKEIDIDKIQIILNSLIKTDDIQNLRYRILEAIDISSPIIGWDNLGVVLQVAHSIRIPLQLRKIPFQEIFLNPGHYNFPIFTCIFYEDKIHQVLVQKISQANVTIKFIDSNESKQLSKDKFLGAIKNVNFTLSNNTEDIKKVKSYLISQNIENENIEQFIQQYGTNELLKVNEYILTVSIKNQAKKDLLKLIFSEKNLWKSITPTFNLSDQPSTAEGFYAVFAENPLNYISDKQSNTSHHGHSHQHHTTKNSTFKIFSLRPVSKLIQLINFERKDLLVLTGYSALVSIFSLVTPLAIDSLVQTITAGIVSLPLIVLTAFVFVGLLITGGLTLIQQFIVEILQQRIFVNTSFEIAQKLPYAKTEEFQEEYAPELINRFFDVVTLQKTFSRLVLDGISAVFIGISAIVLLALFSPLLLAVGIVLVLLSIVIIFLFGRGGLHTSINESHEKYLIAAALEEVGRCLTSYKIVASPHFLFTKLDQLLTQYLYYRKAHFRVMLRQQFSAVILKVILVTTILATGGYLVIERQISLGQLVASQIVVLYLIAAVESLFKQLDNSYDLLTSLEKLAQITDIDQERTGGEILPKIEKGVTITMKNIVFSYTDNQLLTGVNLKIEEGDRFCLVGKSGEGKSTIAHLLVGLNENYSGLIYFDEFDLRTIDLTQLRSNIGLCLPNEEIIEGTISENIRMGRDWISHTDIIKALTLVKLIDEIYTMPRGLETQILSYGKNLSTGQQRRLMLARAIVSTPRLLIIDEAFNGIEENIKLELISELHNPSLPWTIINITHDPDVVSHCKKIAVLSNGKIQEMGTLKNVIENDGEFRRLFPELIV